MITSQITGPKVEVYFDELHEVFKSFIGSSRSTVHLVAPFIRLGALKYLLDDSGSIDVAVITSWHTDDVLSGASDIRIFPYLKRRGFELFVNNSIHAKCVLSDWQKAIFSSANITEKGLGLSTSANSEFAVILNPVPTVTEAWVEKLLSDSVRIGTDTFAEFSRHVKKAFPVDRGVVEDFDFGSNGQNFSLSCLPETDCPDSFLRCLNEIQRGKETFPPELMASFLHDARLFMIDMSRPFKDQRDHLKKAFFSNPFISEFRNFVGCGKYFGESKRWLQGKCADTPKPYLKQLTSHIRILFDWVSDLSNGCYIIERPHYSERLTKVA
jgi:hypothetical protein